MVYIAVATTLSFSETLQSVLFMAMFGLGTLPFMMIVGLGGRMIIQRWRISLQKLVPVFMLLMGVMLFLRGLGLGIPFISPHGMEDAKYVVSCRP